MRFVFDRHLRIGAVLALLALPALASSASADQAFHTLHAELMPVGSAPLQSGFVNDVHTNGTQLAALERYVLNGAIPNTTFQVTIHVFPFDPTCFTTPVAIPTAMLQTNGSGNGEAGFSFAAGPPPLPPGVRHGILWQLSTAGTVVYQTACQTLILD